MAILGSLLVAVVYILVREWNEVNPYENKRIFWIFISLLTIGIILWILRAYHVNLGDPFYFLEK